MWKLDSLKPSTLIFHQLWGPPGCQLAFLKECCSIFSSPSLFVCPPPLSLIFPQHYERHPPLLHFPSVLRGAIILLNNLLMLPVSQPLTAFVVWEGPVKYLQKTKCTYMNLNDTVSANYLSPHIWINSLDLIRIQTKGTSLTIPLDDEITDA